jgi:hypothetical protein
MDLSLDSPQEDELAINVLSGGVSPYMPLVLMKQEPEFRPFFTFKDAASVGGRPAVESWTASFMYFLKKVSLICRLRADSCGFLCRGRLTYLPNPIPCAIDSTQSN